MECLVQLTTTNYYLRMRGTSRTDLLAPLVLPMTLLPPKKLNRSRTHCQTKAKGLRVGQSLDTNAALQLQKRAMKSSMKDLARHTRRPGPSVLE